MNLPYVTSFWSTPDVEPRDPLGARQTHSDVVVIGGGYAGMSAAYYIKSAKPGTKVILLEKEYIGFGPSGRNFGAVVPGLRELRTIFLTDLDPQEEAFAQAWYLEARKELERRIAQGGIECEYRHEPLLMVSLDEEGWAAQQREAELLATRGTPHKLLDRDAIREAMALPYEVIGGLARTQWHAAQPFKLARGLGDQLRELGVEIHEATAVVDMSDDGHRVRITTADGGQVTADKAVLATNAYTNLLPGFAGAIFPRHSHVLATTVLDDKLFNSLGFNEYKFVEDAGLTFYYARVYKNRLLFGGGASSHGLFAQSSIDEAADRDAEEFERIHEEMLRRFPQLKGVPLGAAWGGPVDQTDNFMPIIAPLPEMPNIISNFGFSGDGLLNGCISGKFVTGLVFGAEYGDPDAERIRQYMARA